MSETIYSAGLQISFYKIGKICTMAIEAGSTNTEHHSNTALTTIPTAYMPVISVEVFDTFNKKRIVLGNDGELVPMETISSETAIRASVTYITVA